MNTNLITFSKILWDLDEFVQREGIDMDKKLLRSKLIFLHQNLTNGSREKSVVRGMLNRLNKLKDELILIKLFDILKHLTSNRDIIQFQRKLNISRIENPITLLTFIEDENFPLKIEYEDS